MNEIELLKDLQYRCDKPAAAGLDVSADVTATIRRREAAASAPGDGAGFPALFAMSALAWSTALVLALLADRALSSLNDPLNSLVAPFVVTLR